MYYFVFPSFIEAAVSQTHPILPFQRTVLLCYFANFKGLTTFKRSRVAKMQGRR